MIRLKELKLNKKNKRRRKKKVNIQKSALKTISNIIFIDFITQQVRRTLNLYHYISFEKTI